MRNMPTILFAVFLAILFSIHGGASGANAEKFDWRADWELADGLNMEIDSEGFKFPVQTVFVPNPGPEPKDPLYFVIELKGTVKVVTNDRSVHTFASNFLPNPQGEAFVPTGAAGLCLDSKNGFVFATFAYQDDTAIYRNGIARFSTQPGRFGLKAEKTERFFHLFKNEIAAGGHTIGPCQVKDDLLYVTVGYGEETSSSLDIHRTNGKILRMTLDFKPVSDNPYYEDDGQVTPADYVWAYGFRNPFGLKMVGDRLFATENGGSVDRFNEITKGEVYLSDGTDWSIGARAAQVFAPSIGIVHLDYIPATYNALPEQYRGRFVAAAAGGPGAVGPSVEGRRTVLMLQYDFDKRRMSAVPRPLLRYRGDGMQLPVSIAVGPDGLYFNALLPNKQGATPVFKITHDPSAAYPHRIGASTSPLARVVQLGCRQCHKIGGTGGTAGPKIDSTLVPRLIARLNSDDYVAQVAKVDQIDDEPFRNFRKERADILNVEGLERVQRWLPVYLRQPKFDNPDVSMPALGLSEAEATGIADYLISSTTVDQTDFSTLDHIRFAVARAIPDLRYRHLVISFVLGVCLTVLAGWLAVLVMRRLRGG